MLLFSAVRSCYFGMYTLYEVLNKSAAFIRYSYCSAYFSSIFNKQCSTLRPFFMTSNIYKMEIPWPKRRGAEL